MAEAVAKIKDAADRAHQRAVENGIRLQHYVDDEHEYARTNAHLAQAFFEVSNSLAPAIDGIYALLMKSQEIYTTR